MSEGSIAVFNRICARIVEPRRPLLDPLRALVPAGADFDDDSWNVWSWGRSSHRDGTATVNFGAIDHDEVRAVLKIFLLHRRSSGTTRPGQLIVVGAALSGVLRQRSIFSMKNADVQRVEQALLAQYSGAAQVAELASLVTFLNLWLEIPITYQKPKTAALRYGAQGTDEGRAGKLIDDGVLSQMLALRARTDLDVEDELFVNAVAFNLGCGFRAAELLSLPRDCLMEDEGALYVRSFEAKGGLAAPRVVIPELVDVVRSAHRSLVEITEPGRMIARAWAEADEPDWACTLKDENATLYFVEKVLHRWTSDPANRLINPDAAWHFGRSEWIDVLGLLERNNGAITKTSAELGLVWETFTDLCKQQQASREGRLYQRTAGRTLKNLQRDQRVMNQYQFFRSIGFASGQMRKSSALDDLMLQATACQIKGTAYPNPVRREDLEGRFRRQRPILLQTTDGVPLLHVDEALFVTPRFLFGAHETKTADFKVIETAQLFQWLNGRRGRASVFERFGILDPRSGAVAKFTSHDIRHWLNTAFQRGGLSQVQIATLFNRHDVRGNSPYNHISNEERRTAIATGIKNEAITGHIAEAFHAVAAIDRTEAEDYLISMTRQINVMPHGLCAKDLVSEACPHHLSCFSCETDDSGTGRPCSFLIVDPTDAAQQTEIQRIKHGAQAMVAWFEEDGLTQAPQYRHFKAVADATGVALRDGKDDG